MNVNSIDKEMTQKYFPMLTPMRQKKISEIPTAHERAIVFASEILARQCLSEVFDAPEFSFSLLCNPNSKSILGNFNGNLCIVANNDWVACVADTKAIGIALVTVDKFSFNDAQKNFSDAEIRYIFAPSVYSFSRIINMPQCSEKEIMLRYAQFLSLKEAVFNASGRIIRSNPKKTEFSVQNNKIICSDENYEVQETKYIEPANMFLSVVNKN